MGYALSPSYALFLPSCRPFESDFPPLIAPRRALAALPPLTIIVRLCLLSFEPDATSRAGSRLRSFTRSPLSLFLSLPPPPLSLCVSRYISFPRPTRRAFSLVRLSPISLLSHFSPTASDVPPRFIYPPHYPSPCNWIVYVLCIGIAAWNCPSHSEVAAARSLPARRFTSRDYDYQLAPLLFPRISPISQFPPCRSVSSSRVPWLSHFSLSFSPLLQGSRGRVAERSGEEDGGPCSLFPPLPFRVRTLSASPCLYRILLPFSLSAYVPLDHPFSAILANYYLPILFVFLFPSSDFHALASLPPCLSIVISIPSLVLLVFSSSHNSFLSFSYRSVHIFFLRYVFYHFTFVLYSSYHNCYSLLFVLFLSPFPFDQLITINPSLCLSSFHTYSSFIIFVRRDTLTRNRSSYCTFAYFVVFVISISR